MLSEYIEKALARVLVEKAGEGEYVASLPDFHGPWGHGKTRAEAKEHLRSVFEEWLVTALREDEDLPEMDGVSLNFGGRRWQRQRVAGRESESSGTWDLRGLSRAADTNSCAGEGSEFTCRTLTEMNFRLDW